jgi:hypothetical protein
MSARLAPSSRPLPLHFVAFLSFFVFPLAFAPLGNKRHHHRHHPRGSFCLGVGPKSTQSLPQSLPKVGLATPVDLERRAAVTCSHPLDPTSTQSRELLASLALLRKIETKVETRVYRGKTQEQLAPKPKGSQL